MNALLLALLLSAPADAASRISAPKSGGASTSLTSDAQYGSQNSSITAGVGYFSNLRGLNANGIHVSSQTTFTSSVTVNGVDLGIRNTTPKINLLDASGSLVGYLAYESGGTATVLRGVADDVGITDPAGNRLLTLKSNGGLVLLAGTTIYGNVGTVSLTTAAYNTSVSSTPNIFIDNSGRVGIRNGKPTQSLSIDNYGATPIVYVRRGNGAVTAPTALVSGNVFGAFEAGGFDGTSYGTKNTIMQSDAMENWSTTAKGSRTSFSVTTVGTANLVTAMNITSPVAGEGYVGFGTSLPSTRIHASSGTLLVDGTGADINVTNLVRFNSSLTNTHLGNDAGNMATITGNQSTFVGHGAGAAVTSGSKNTFMGYGAGAAMLSSDNNVFIGHQAGPSATGAGNTIIGGALAGGSLNSGTYNTMIGHQVGYETTTGGSNVYMGYDAGRPNLSGSQQVMIGVAAKPVSNALSNAIAIGYDSQVNVANGIQLGNASVTSVATFGSITTRSTMTVAGNAIGIQTYQSPASNAACEAGTIAVDANYIYLCTASAVWKRAALTGGY